MIRCITVLALAGLLALSVSISGFAGLPPDADGDGTPNDADNCLVLPNGPDTSTSSCMAQEDGDLDGYGNPCDTDYNNDGATGLDDVIAVLGQSDVVGTDPTFDQNCDGATGLDDVIRTLADSDVVRVPGPSGRACAGSVPCP